ncbi:MAG: flavodoxin family protein [bacterium]|nr:MAG: flavodoxin family protein [bacterium]
MSGRKVLILLGSPRKAGNSAILAGRLAEGARSVGSEVDRFYLHDLDINPCTACEGCHREGSRGCVVDDDMQPIYGKLADADSIVFATPVYWFSVTAQIKTVIDRLYAVGVGDDNILAGKNLGILMVYADSDPFTSGAVNALRMFQDISGYLGTEIVGMVYGTAAGAGQIEGNEQLLEDAFRLGVKLGGG